MNQCEALWIGFNGTAWKPNACSPRGFAPVDVSRRRSTAIHSTLRVRFMEGTDGQKDIARNQAGWWEKHANLRFDFSDDPDAEIRITFDPDDGAWSYVGTDCLSIPRRN